MLLELTTVTVCVPLVTVPENAPLDTLRQVDAAHHVPLPMIAPVPSWTPVPDTLVVCAVAIVAKQTINNARIFFIKLLTEY